MAYRSTHTLIVHVLCTGTLSVDKAVAYGERNPLAPTGFLRSKKNRVTLPINVFLVEHPRGLILFDTGWDKSVREQSPSRFLGLEPPEHGLLPPGKAIDEQLAHLGYRPEDLSYIFLSHLDTDHISGLRHLKAATRVMAAAQEIKDASSFLHAFRYERSLINEFNITPFQYAPASFAPFNRAYDVFGDRNIILVNTPGHSRGLFTALLSSGEDFIALPGDTGYGERSWENIHIPGLAINRKNARTSLAWIKELARDPHCKGIFSAHDPDVKPGVITLG